MKNKTPGMSQHSRLQAPEWLYQNIEVQEDDFLSGKVPQDLQEYTWEDEE